MKQLQVVFGYVLMIIGSLMIVLSVLALCFSVLGFLGILADVSPAENRAFAWQFALMGLPLFLIGGGILVAGVTVKRTGAGETREMEM